MVLVDYITLKVTLIILLHFAFKLKVTPLATVVSSYAVKYHFQINVTCHDIITFHLESWINVTSFIKKYHYDSSI